MSQICIINNSLDAVEQTVIDSENVLKTLLDIRVTFPQARIYKGNPCPENDMTPSRDDRESIARLLESDEDFTIVCYPGDVISAVNWAVGKLFGAAVNAFIKVPKNKNDSSTGSSNNNLANAENKQRIKERIPRVVGQVKSVPDLYAPEVRYFKDGVEVEELLMCVCENPIEASQVKEGDTPVEEIPGKSVTIYAPNQSIVGTENIFKVGDDFTEAPIIAKQNASVNGQTLLPPNSTRVEDSDMYFQYPNLIRTTGSTDDFDEFVVNETVVIEGANFGVADITITGSVSIDQVTRSIMIQSSQSVPNYTSFRKLNVTSLLATDPEAGQLDLAGLYNIASVEYSNGYYNIYLSNPSSTNTNWTKITAELTTTISANLTANTASIFLDGAYTITGIDKTNKQISLASPSSVNSDWSKLANLTGQKTDVSKIKLRGSQDNWIGWFTIDSKQAKALLLNFRAGNGIYQGSKAKKVSIAVEYQQVVDNQGTGVIYEESITIEGRKNNRDAIGGSLWIDLPFSGAVRFRARRTNDNGDDADLMDETKFYSAYAYHRLEKLIYDNRVLIRARTVATANATSQDSRQLNLIAQSLVYSYRGGVKSAERIASRNIADHVIDLALDPKIGRRSINEINTTQLYAVVDQIQAYFGSEKMTEFNYTLDNDNTSFEEITRMMAAATCTHDRRLNRNIFFELESAENEPLILFNHRNKEPGSEKRKYTLRDNKAYDGVELTYIDSENGWIEKTIKVPEEILNNPKKIDATGVIYTQQAHILAWREWNKLKFNRITVNFKGYAESDLIAKGDSILCADDTRVGGTVSDGYIKAWNGLNITVSQPFNFSSGNFVIHLQIKSGRIDSIPVSMGSDEYNLRLGRVPNESLITVGEIPTGYIISTSTKEGEQKFLVSSKKPSAIFENDVTAINWDARYYANDKDIIKELI
ncbi:hypothetical protein G9F31_00765 [Acinetobacter sp. 187]|uniref:host specificity factor TipJ family phage tail protein n=1 Tax=Acinetobacter lanii TaxID=2715163 RepID=UPI001407C652|nr:host specificity factor TipJ family phage tail protein [Acinetobacter lanii]NHC02316.1 hypothetical protein [Acinetobacter lanii]